MTAVKGSVTAGTVIPEGMYVYYKFDNDFNDATENAVHGSAPTPRRLLKALRQILKL